MTTDNKTLADVQPGGRVRLGDGLRSELLDQAERLECMAAQDRETGESIEQALEAGEEYTPDDAPDVAAGLQHDANRSEEIAALLRKAAAALSAQPSPGGQGDARSFVIAAYRKDGKHSIADAMEDGSYFPPYVQRAVNAVEAALAARQPVYVQGSDELRARTEGERAAYMEGLEEGKKIASRQPVGEPPMEMRICELRHVSLKPNRPYVFTVDANCANCRADAAYAMGHTDTRPAQAVDLPYSLDADPAGIRARVCDVITGTLMVGAQGHTPPPAGHWAEQFWHAARADAGLQVKMREALWAAARSLRAIADSTKETEFLETAGEIRAYAGSPANCAKQVLTDSGGVKLG